MGSGVHMSKRKWVMADASMVVDVASIPAKTRLVYSLASFPSIWTSATSALSHEADQVSTATSVYALLKSETTLAASSVGVGAAAVGVDGGGV